MISLVELTELSDTFANLTALQILNIVAFMKLTKLPTFEQLTSLQSLTIKYCKELQRLPVFASKCLKTLEIVYMMSQTKLKYLPSLSMLSGLERLDLETETIRELPALFRDLIALRKMKSWMRK